MILYHGMLDKYAHDICENGINLNKSKPLLDFGKGFYTTNEIKFSLRTARYRANKNNIFKNQYAKPAVVILKINNSQCKNFKIKKFDCANEQWAKFIINNRCKRECIKKKKLINHNHDSKYDIVIGPTADGNITNIMYELGKGAYRINKGIYKEFLTDEGKDLGKQISFHTKEVISCIEILKYVII